MLSDIYPLRHPPNTHEGFIAERSHSQRRTTKNITNTTTTAAATTASAANAKGIGYLSCISSHDAVLEGRV